MVENILGKFQRNSSATFISEESPQHNWILIVAVLRNTVSSFAPHFEGVVIIIPMLETLGLQIKFGPMDSDGQYFVKYIQRQPQ